MKNLYIVSYLKAGWSPIFKCYYANKKKAIKRIEFIENQENQKYIMTSLYQEKNGEYTFKGSYEEDDTELKNLTE